MCQGMLIIDSTPDASYDETGENTNVLEYLVNPGFEISQDNHEDIESTISMGCIQSLSPASISLSIVHEETQLLSAMPNRMGFIA